jgi:tRNA pseudouridine38-40 synthase
VRIKLIIAYDGTCYCGWQVQPNGVSIQKIVQGALETVLRHPVALTGSSRTDAGVHAYGQVAHFDTAVLIDPKRLRLSLNALLPPDIRVMDVERVADDFHARYSATSKIYHYHLHCNGPVDPHVRLYRTRLYGFCDRKALCAATGLLIGQHDFRPFANVSGKDPKDPIRTLSRLDVVEERGGVRLEFEGDGFLYKMVRNIVGALMEVATGIRAPESIWQQTRRSTAPAQGLTLIQVNYP